MRRLLTVAAAACALLALPAAAHADPPPPGATWNQATITEPDGTKLHADVLRPSNLPADAKTPVIVSVGPYFNHSGQTGPAGPAEDTPYTPVGDAGPSARFYDFVEGAHLMERGYSFVMVDLRGFGGSSGCLDWGGPGEQADVKSAVEWAAGRSWSTGKVGMYGKSYDAVTGLMGIATQPKGLSAVVAQEPVYDLYRYLYSNGVRFVNSLATPALYDAIAATPGTTGDELSYQADGADDTARPGCPALNYLDQQNADHQASYWRQRDLIAKTRGKPTPLFLTQGFLEDNTKPDGTWDLFNGLAGPKRAWFGMWDHVRGNETDASGRLKEGRAGFFDEVMRFYDQHLKGETPAVTDPTIAVQTSDGSWRAEDAWPPADARAAAQPLNTGSYRDDGTNNGTAEGGSPNGEGVWTFSPPLAGEAHLAGVPKLTVDAEPAVPNANLVADVYDVAPDGAATLISRNAELLRGAGATTLDLYGDDWKLPAGHRVGVLLTGANAEWWAHVPTGGDVTVRAASIALPWLDCARTSTIQGDPSVKLEDYRAAAPFTVDSHTIEDATSTGLSAPPTRDCSP
jgi:predicted acyl esterase